MKQTVLFLMVLLLSACMESEKKSKTGEPVCAPSAKCNPYVDWLIETEVGDFPANISMAINDMELINECAGTLNLPPSNIQRDVVTAISLRFFFPLEDTLRLEIKDLGADCDQDLMYYQNDLQAFQYQNRTVLIEI